MHYHDVAPRPAAPTSVQLQDRAGREIVRLALLAALLGAACAPQEPDAEARREADSAALDRAYALFSEAYARANVQLLMDEVYARDAFYLPPASPILQGQDQFRGQFSFLERFARDGGPGPRISFDIMDRDIDGDLAYDIGVYSILPPDAPDDAEPSQRKFIVIWKRIDGDWRIWADGFSPVE